MANSLKAHQLQGQITRLDNLPTLPAVAVELVKLWNKPDLSVRLVTELLSQDPGLTTKVLQVVNSSRGRTQKEISSVKHAATLLGLNTLRCVTLGVTVFESFNDYRAPWAEVLDPKEFWRHSLAVGVAGEMIARRLDFSAPEEAFVAGLLHDIGKLAFLICEPEGYTKVLKQASSGKQSLLDLETEHFKVSHVEVGKWLGERWNLPEQFRNAIWLHHQPPTSTKGDNTSPDRLGKIIYLADYLTRMGRIGDSGNHRLGTDELWALDQYGFKSENQIELVTQLLEKVQEIGNILSLPTPTMQVYMKALEEANRHLSAAANEIQNQFEIERENANLLQLMLELSHLPVHQEPSLTLMARAAALIREFGQFKWMLLFTHDKKDRILEGVLVSSQYKFPQTFYRLIDSGLESGNGNGNGKGAGEVHLADNAIDFLGETLLSSGQRLNLKNEVLKILGRGKLLAIPLEIDDHCMGECFIDVSDSRLEGSSYNQGLRSLVETTAKVVERGRLYRRVRREAEVAAESLRRESEAQRQLYHADRLASVGRLAAGAAHEINNPLAVISGKAQLLLYREDDDKKCKALRDIVDQTIRISKIISDLMGYARPTQPEVAEVALEDLVENALNMAFHRIRKTAITQLIEIPPDLPKLYVDARQIEQVLVNLFVNALQAMGEEGSLTIRAEFLEASKMVSVQVMDSGPGIRPENLARIFDPFFTTKREGEGTGLGLAVSHSIIEAHGGNMSVSSRLGEGTTFTLTLPVVSEKNEVFKPEVVEVQAMPRKGSKRRILLVDDEKDLSELIKDYLTDAGYVVDVANDGVEGMEMLNKRVYDALIIDIRMPRKTGLEVLEDLKRTTPGIPTLVITGLATTEECDQALEYGADRILKKPFRLDDLLTSVQKITKQQT